MKGHFPTPPAVVDTMVEKLFRRRRPASSDKLLDPGCGTGPFVEGVLRWCERHGSEKPQIVGVDNDLALLDVAKRRIRNSHVTFRPDDFLRTDPGMFDFVVGNPPYVSIERLSLEEKTAYRSRFHAAVQRFDLYMLFWEQALRHLRPDGRLVFITPEKFHYVSSAGNLRRILSIRQVEEIHFLGEGTFPELLTYPVVTTMTQRPNDGTLPTRILDRNGNITTVVLPSDRRSWAPVLRAHEEAADGAPTLEELCIRISCGVATGADDVYVRKAHLLPQALLPFAMPTVSGRQITAMGDSLSPTDCLLLPYRENGRLMPEPGLGFLGRYLDASRRRLKRRTCVSKGGKPWFAFHENPPLPDLLRPKILCKDITPNPRFWIDREGTIVPRHSLYYIVPKNPTDIEGLAEYLNGPAVARWIDAHSQRAANGFLRLQSSVLRNIPIPTAFLPKASSARVNEGGPAISAPLVG